MTARRIWGNVVSRFDRYVVEARNPDGSLNFDKPQPEDFYGLGAIQGLSEDALAAPIFRRDPDVVLDGRTLLLWPRELDPRFTARKKYW